jgi:hypothetical protein
MARASRARRAFSTRRATRSSGASTAAKGVFMPFTCLFYFPGRTAAHGIVLRCKPPWVLNRAYRDSALLSAHYHGDIDVTVSNCGDLTEQPATLASLVGLRHVRHCPGGILGRPVPSQHDPVSQAYARGRRGRRRGRPARSRPATAARLRRPASQVRRRAAATASVIVGKRMARLCNGAWPLSQRCRRLVDGVAQPDVGVGAPPHVGLVIHGKRFA